MIHRLTFTLAVLLICMPLVPQPFRGPANSEISGDVMDDNDEPLQAEVRVYQFIVRGGRMTVALGCATSSTNAGLFRCEHLRPGAYLLVADNLRRMARREDKQALAQPESPLPLFAVYPMVSGIEYSDLVHLANGDQRTLTIRTSSDDLASVEVLSAAPTVKNRQLNIELQCAGVQIPAYTVSVRNREERYEVQRLPAGQQYNLVERWSEGGLEHEAAGATMANGVQAAAIRLIEINQYDLAGSVQYPSDQAASASYALSLTSSDPHADHQYVTSMNKSGSFLLKGVETGGYYVSFDLGAGSYIGGLTQGGQNVDGNKVVINDATASLPLGLAAKQASGEIAGSLELDGSEPAPGIVLQSLDFHESRLVHVEPSGLFQIRGLPPGRYRVYAWANWSEIPYKNEGFLQRNADHATEVTLEDGSILRDLHLECVQPVF